MKLSEIKKPDPVDPNEAVIEQFMEGNEIKNWSIGKDGRVDVDGNVSIYYNVPNGKFPFPWGEIRGSFNAEFVGLRSYENFPTIIHGRCYIERNKFSSFDGLSGTQRYDSYDFYSNPIKSLHDIHKHITNTSSISFHNCPVEKAILGLCLIKNLRFLNDYAPAYKITFEIFEPSRKKNELEYVDAETGEIYVARAAAFFIVNKHLSEGKAGVLAAQEEMLELELDAYAEL